MLTTSNVENQELESEIIAIDAIKYSSHDAQFEEKDILRFKATLDWN